MGHVVEQIAKVAEQVLFPVAQETDQAARVPDASLRALADAGAFGISANGTDAEKRQVHRLLGGACGATYFVWAQHEGPARLLAASPNLGLREQWLDRLLAGHVIGGTAFAHVRRPGPPLVRATPVAGGGWQFDGEAPWASSWGMADVYSVVAITPTGSVLWVLIPASRLTPTQPLQLAVMQATATVRLRFDATPVSPDDVLFEFDRGLWDAIDASIANRGNPAVQGLTARALQLLEATGDLGAAVAAGLLVRLAQTTADNDGLSNAADAGQADVPAMAAARAESIDIAQRATLALLTAVGGRGMEMAHPAQRLVREAAFYAIQGQTGDGRTASLNLGR